jgi:hypothetical protein
VRSSNLFRNHPSSLPELMFRLLFFNSFDNPSDVTLRDNLSITAAGRISAQGKFGRVHPRAPGCCSPSLLPLTAIFPTRPAVASSPPPPRVPGRSEKPSRREGVRPRVRFLRSVSPFPPLGERVGARRAFSLGPTLLALRLPHGAWPSCLREIQDSALAYHNLAGCVSQVFVCFRKP